MDINTTIKYFKFSFTLVFQIIVMYYLIEISKISNQKLFDFNFLTHQHLLWHGEILNNTPRVMNFSKIN